MVALHVTSVVLGLVTGLTVVLSKKGTTLHRMLGRVYVVALLVTAVSSFWILELRDGRPSVFHGVSVLITIVVLAGVVAIRRGNRWLHALLMPSSLLMTAITGVAQFFDRLPFPSEALNAIVFLQVPSIVGFICVWRAAAKLRPKAGPVSER